MPTRNVVLTDHQAAMIARLVASGRYQNASEVLREGLCLIETRDAEEAARLEALREAVAVGIRDIAEGRYTVLDSAEALAGHFDAIAEQAFATPEAPRPPAE
jgi:antitoxin ParD1/3/4